MTEEELFEKTLQLVIDKPEQATEIIISTTLLINELVEQGILKEQHATHH